jgi:glycolate oxidase FAD binding subunit
VSAIGASLDLARELRAVCGEEHVIEREVDGAATPPVIATPGSADEVVAIVRLANQRGISIAPAGILPTSWGGRPSVDIVLSTARLTEIEHYDHADLTVGVGTGMPVAQLNALVGADNLMFACDPPLPERTTVGEVIAAAMQGPLRHGYGGVRDFCIGIRFVTGDGRKAKGGGRVVKNVAGYDLMKLLIGSYGTLAVITSASFKLFPAPRQTRTFLAEFATWQEALKFRDLVLRSPLAPMCLELVSPRARKLMRPEMTDDAWVICVRGSGSDAVLARYRKELGSAVTREVDGDNEIKMWRVVEDFPLNLQGVSGPFSIFIPPADLGAAIQAIESLNPQVTTAAYIGRVGVGHLLVSFPSANPDSSNNVQVLDRVSLPSSAHVKQRGFLKQRISAGTLAAMRAVKHALDPNNILPGRELF